MADIEIQLMPKLESLLQSLEKAPNIEDAWVSIERFFMAEGFEWVSYVSEKSMTDDTNEPYYMRNNYPISFSTNFAHSEYADGDYTLVHMRQSLRPLLMGLDVAPLESVPEKFRQLPQDVYEFGFKSGVGIPCRTDSETLLNGFAFSGGMNANDFLKYLDQHINFINLAAIYAHMFLQRLIKKQKQAHIQLSDREIDVLSYAAKGLMNARIAEKMNISERTVHFHITNARQKLKASNRTHALAKAIAAGLITP